MVKQDNVITATVFVILNHKKTKKKNPFVVS